MASVSTPFARTILADLVQGDERGTILSRSSTGTANPSPGETVLPSRVTVTRAARRSPRPPRRRRDSGTSASVCTALRMVVSFRWGRCAAARSTARAHGGLPPVRALHRVRTLHVPGPRPRTRRQTRSVPEARAPERRQRRWTTLGSARRPARREILDTPLRGGRHQAQDGDVRGALRPDDHGVVPRRVPVSFLGDLHAQHPTRDSRFVSRAILLSGARRRAGHEILHHVEARHHEAPLRERRPHHARAARGVPTIARAVRVVHRERHHRERDAASNTRVAFASSTSARAGSICGESAPCTRATRRARRARGGGDRGTANRRRGHRPSREPRRPRGSSRTSSGGSRGARSRDSPTIASSPSDELRFAHERERVCAEGGARSPTRRTRATPCCRFLARVFRVGEGRVHRNRARLGVWPIGLRAPSRC